MDIMHKQFWILVPLLLSGCITMETPEQMMERISRQSEEKASAAILSDPSPHERTRAARELGRKGDAASVDLLIKALGDADAMVRAAAAEGLRDAGDAGAKGREPVMAALLAESDPSAVVAMGWALQRWKVDLRPASDVFAGVMSQTNNPRARYHAALLTRSFAEVSVLAPVYVDTLGTKVAQDARNKPDELISDLIPKNGKTLIPFVVAGAESENPATRAEVARLLRKFKPPVDPMERVRQLRENPQADIMKTILPAEVEAALLRLLADPDASVRAAAAWSAGMCDPAPDASVPLLRGLLKDTNEAVRSAAVYAIGPMVVLKRAPKETLDDMSFLIDDESAKVRAAAAHSLAQQGSLPANITKKLALKLDASREPDAYARSMIAAALGSGAKSPEMTTALLKGLKDSDKTVVERTLSSIGQSGVEDADVLTLVADLTRPEADFGIRLNALGALNTLGAKARPVRAHVVAAAGDPNEAIRSAAQFALKNID